MDTEGQYMMRKVVAGTILLLVLAGPLLTSLLGHTAGESGLPYDSSSQAGLFGTEHLGRNVAVAVLSGGQVLVATAIIAGSLTTFIGVMIGSLGVLKPRLGFVIEALADATILIPAVLVLLVATVLYPNAGVWLLIAVVVVVGSPYAARVIAGAAYPIAQSGYVQAARSSGASTWSLIWRDIAPNISEVIRTVLGLRIVEALYLLATASFLGVGRGLGEFAWSSMVRDNAAGFALNPAAVLAPAGAIAVTSIAIIVLLKQPKEAKC